MMKELVLILLFCALFGSALSRRVVKTLTVSDTRGWGTWYSAEYCPYGQYAYGYRMKIDEDQGSGDDTSLNGIELLCRKGATVSSQIGEWGYWTNFSQCSYNANLVAFNLQSEPYQGTGKDDSAANFVKFECRDNTGYIHVLATSPGTGNWGYYTGWSHSCDRGSAICGLETAVEPNQGSGHAADDTALNDVRFFCCND